MKDSRYINSPSYRAEHTLSYKIVMVTAFLLYMGFIAIIFAISL